MKTADHMQSTNAGNQDTRTSPAAPRPADSTSRLPGGSRRWHWLRRRVKDGHVARSSAAAWMTLLIAVPVVVAFLTVWGGLARTSRPDELSVAALKLFAVWCLSFLPGWLYVRFLGLRAGALWDEYVLYLHRLGWDRPAHLPEPARNSDFYQEWLDDGGKGQPKEQNIYRQKFAAYYGRSIPDTASATSDFSVRTENMFPVFLTTVVLAVCWVAVLWNTSSATNPEGIWDILKFAFLGAYAFIVQSLIRRFYQSDLRPSAYASVVLRIIVVLVTMAALHQLLGAVTPATEAAIAFVVGFFPVIAFQALQRAAAATLRVFVPQLTPDYPLNQLDGLNVWYEARLVEEGIEDMQNLATANLVDVILHTRVPVGRLVDWVDQAKLYLHLDRAERGYHERRLVRATEKPAVNDNGMAPTDQQPPEGDGQDQAAPMPADNGKAPSDQSPSAPGDAHAYDPLVHGSLSPHNRAGTKTRVALRQLGIRTATDLLKAFPPEQIDRRIDDNDADRLRFRKLKAAGLDQDQLRTLVRVLDEDTALAPIWNWQTRGVQARRDCRRPRSQRTGTGSCDATAHQGQPPHAGAPAPSGRRHHQSRARQARRRRRAPMS
jgi:hypothetical protein